jgi:hypothetical protein
MIKRFSISAQSPQQGFEAEESLSKFAANNLDFSASKSCRYLAHTDDQIIPAVEDSFQQVSRNLTR